MMQQFIIALSLIVSVLYLVWSFSSLTRRQRWLDALAHRGLLVGMAARHRARLGTPGCGNCASAGTHPVPRPPAH